MEIEFKEGDWIIATKPMMVESFGGFSTMFGGRTLIPEKAYMHKPYRVQAVTDSHLILEQGEKDSKPFILSLYEVKERAFIIADDRIVKLLYPDVVSV